MKHTLFLQVLGYYLRNNIETENLIKEIKSIASLPTEKFFFNVSEEAALATIAGTLGNRIFNIEGEYYYFFISALLYPLHGFFRNIHLHQFLFLLFFFLGTGKEGENFQMEMSQVGFSAHYAKQQVLQTTTEILMYDLINICFSLLCVIIGR